VIAVIGCGNPSRSDDGAGPAVVRLLRERGLASTPGLRLLDAGTDGMGVVYAARGCRSLLLVDACRTGAEAGAVYEVPGEQLEREAERSFTLHDFRWDHALHAGRRTYGAAFPTDVVVLLIEVQTVAPGLELSPPVASAVLRVADRVAGLVLERAATGVPT
jgi:hydrogenase maturation protease